LQKVIEMIEREESCLSVAQQLQAVVSAMSSAKTIYVRDHIEHCLVDVIERSGNPRRKIEEFKEIAKYL